ncbi:MAG: thiamine-phosphate kinase, partial [Rhodocyclaceae bacterium]|nr:thiamine-phosphate kinase [Rhodocyclaceae bacterium]
VSDGLLGDLGHLLDASAVGAQLDAASLPLAALRAAGADARGAQRACLSGGDDYELLFAAPPAQHAAVRAIGARLGLPLHCIGRLTPPDAGLTLIDANGRSTPLARHGFDHFAPPPA